MIEKARVVLDSDDYVELPTKFDIHEYRIMEEFCPSLQLPQLRDQLLRKISGSGAFGRFKQAIYSLGIEEDSYQFRNAEYVRIAIEWMEENGIAYTRELNTERHSE